MLVFPKESSLVASRYGNANTKTTHHKQPPLYTGRSAWAVLPKSREPEIAGLDQWLEWSEGRIYWDKSVAEKWVRTGEQLIQVPNQVQFRQTWPWHIWAFDFIRDLEKATCRAPPCLYPTICPTASVQLHSSFESIVQRFYHDALFHVAQHCSVAWRPDDVYFLPLTVQWAQLIDQTYADQPQQIEGTWRLLWTTAGEMLEWFVNRARKVFGKLPSDCGKSFRPYPEELYCINDIIVAWQLCTMHSPEQYRPRKVGPIETYVHIELTKYWKDLQAGVRRPLPNCPPLTILRMPQLDKLPTEWVWRRQVRTKRGVYFGMQDLLFYRNWKDAKNNCGRHRSYKEIAKTLHR